jgi:hypothetical protein
MTTNTTTMTMTSLDENICEQLSAWMDGELSKQEALFLERRLQHDEALQAMYSRLQMTSACMKGQSARWMPNALCANIKLALAEETVTRKSRRPLLAWAAAASMAFAAIVFIPGMMQNTAAPEPTLAHNNSENNSEVIANNDIDPPATFASADLVANTFSAVSAVPTLDPVTSEAGIKPVTNPPPIEIAAVTSPENFPLNVSSEKKTWPRSPINANSDPALEAYLVRHNQMMAQDGMGGFLPYVDVVAQDADKTDQKTSGSEGDIK